MSDRAALESIYRFALRSYPARWRAEHGEEILGVMLDVAASRNKAKASLSDVAHLVLHGLVARVNRVLSVVPRRRRDRLAALGLIAGTALALVMIILGELGRWLRWQSYTFSDNLFGPVTTPAAVIFTLMLGAFLAHVVSRVALAKVLHGITIAACIGVAVMMKTTNSTIVVPLAVLLCFAGMSVLCLLGDPLRTPVLRRLVLIGAPTIGIFITFTSYLQGGGAQKTFWRPKYFDGIDAFALSIWTTQLVLIATMLVISGRMIRPWAHLVLIPLAAIPLTELFLRVFWYGASGLINIDLGFLSFACSPVALTVCTIAALTTAWITWKQPVLVFQNDSTKPTTN